MLERYKSQFPQGAGIMVSGTVKMNSFDEEERGGESIEKDMREIKLYYKDFKGKHPELFTIGNIQ